MRQYEQKTPNWEKSLIEPIYTVHTCTRIAYRELYQVTSASTISYCRSAIRLRHALFRLQINSDIKIRFAQYL